MRATALLVVGVGCSSLPTHRWVYDAERACFAYDETGLQDAAFPAADCPVAELPAVTASGQCVILPVSCLPSGYGPAAASPACADAWAVWASEDAICDGLTDGADARTAPSGPAPSG